MILVGREKSKTISLTTAGSATDVRISIVHEWGDIVKEETLVNAGPGTSFSYTMTPEETSSSGVHKAIWKYIILGVEYTTRVDFKIYTPYITASEFFASNSYLDNTRNQDNFDKIERVVRGIIDNYCNQDFQYINNKTLTLDGSGKSTLGTIYRVENLTSIVTDDGDDLTEEIEISPESKFYIRRKTISTSIPSDSSEWPTVRPFSKKRVYSIKGSFGWPYVPQNVTDAAELLIADEMNQDSVHRKHKITFAGTGPVQLRYSQDLVGTTGNQDADLLLMDYSKWLMSYI